MSRNRCMFFKKRLYFYFYLCVSLCIFAHTCWCPQRPEAGVGSLGDGVEGGCEPQDLSARN